MSNTVESILPKGLTLEEIRDIRCRRWDDLYLTIEVQVEKRVRLSNSVTREDREDMVIEVGKKVFSEIEQISSLANLEGAIQNAISRILIDHLRKVHAKRRDLKSKATYAEAATNDDDSAICSAKISADDAAIQVSKDNDDLPSKRRAIEEIMARLDADKQKLYYLKYDGYTTDEIGQILGKSEGMVEKNWLELRGEIKNLVQK